ncbi:ornithine decarboxylase [Arthrobacter sp. E918]|uniref:Ornithine decarboxylase n=1 Tax=Arthrobacter mobilis TaxID=2724944 RepID=A0A7X6HD82_9MICC|nr:ornithine decarboxylase [Arthrobacter mobilis]
MPGPGFPGGIWRQRADDWEFLAQAARQLAGSAPGHPGSAVLAECLRRLDRLEPLEAYWAFPGPGQVGRIRRCLRDGDFRAALGLAEATARRLGPVPGGNPGEEAPEAPERHSFEVLVIDDVSPAERALLQESMHRLRHASDQFTYTVNVVPSVEDALMAVLLNPEIQACVVRPGFANRSRARLDPGLAGYLGTVAGADLEQLAALPRTLRLAEGIAALRPELDLYLVAAVAIEEVAGSLASRFRRVFRWQALQELHLSILAGVAERYETPFFDAVRRHSQRPAGVFHAMPVSRGTSVTTSKWIGDLGGFYGLNLFLAETSTTAGGLDSLLDPHGSLRAAQVKAARAFGAQRTWFVTNGTSTANKIAIQSIVAPGDVVLVDRNCHKSHHYALMLAGARVAYLEAYPLDEYSVYGAVPLENLKRMLLDYRRAGRLEEVKLVALTNCTFDGIVYDVHRVMAECLAIKPDLVFLWDEAWFAFGAFHPVLRRRTAMAAARRLEQDLAGPEAAARYAEQAAALHDAATGEPLEDELWLRTRLVPDPARTRVRVYATQSTHKTLTALRQGSMIHVYDRDFNRLNAESFREAYMTHTSTSPNYQILASLDAGRRQVELEGFELVQRQVDLAGSIAAAVERQPLLRKYFRILGPGDLIPPACRQDPPHGAGAVGLAELDRAWRADEFVLDPSRLTLHIGLTGVDGDSFRTSCLMDRFGIQVNKTSRNTVLLMTNIGTTRSAVAYLIEVLVQLAAAFDEEQAGMSPAELQARAARVASLTTAPPPLPDFSRFADRFRSGPDTPDGDLRTAHFLTYREGSCRYLLPEAAARLVDGGEELVSAAFVTPYPPGFPVLVPGQVITREILEYMAALDVREVHGFHPEFGYRVLA